MATVSSVRVSSANASSCQKELEQWIPLEVDNWPTWPSFTQVRYALMIRLYTVLVLAVTSKEIIIEYIRRARLHLDVRHDSYWMCFHSFRSDHHEYHLVSDNGLALYSNLIITNYRILHSKSTIKQWRTEQSNELKQIQMRNFGSTSFLQFEEEISVSRVNYEFWHGDKRWSN